jgi:hypothetical protein
MDLPANLSLINFRHLNEKCLFTRAAMLYRMGFCVVDILWTGHASSARRFHLSVEI